MADAGTDSIDGIIVARTAEKRVSAQILRVDVKDERRNTMEMLIDRRLRVTDDHSCQIMKALLVRGVVRK